MKTTLKNLSWSIGLRIIAAHLLFIITVHATAQQVVPAKRFGDHGFSTTAEDAEFISVNNIILQPDKKILVSTFSDDNYSYTPRYDMRRLNPDGTLDSTFGTKGIKKIYYKKSRPDRYADGTAIQSTGKIITLSDYSDTHYGIKEDTVWLQRFLPDGSLDSSFGNQGAVTICRKGSIVMGTCVLVKQDDKILTVVSTDGVAALMQYLPDGAADSSFGVNGIAESSSPYDMLVKKIMLLPNGKIMAASSAYVGPNNGYTNCLVLYNSRGKIDSSQGNNGIVAVRNSNSDGVFNLKLQHDGKILFYTCNDGNNALYRFLENGLPDYGFGDSGHVTPGGTYAYYPTRNVDVQADGKIVVNLFHGSEFSRFNIDGSLDSSFGSNGILTVPGINAISSFIIEHSRLIIASDHFEGLNGFVQTAVYVPCLGCSAVNAVFAAEENKISRDHFIIYPNPANSFVHVQTDNTATFTLIDLSGKIVLSKTISNSSDINVSQLPPGIYYLRNNNTGEVKKLVITH